MINIKKSPTADSRTCDFKNVTKSELLNSSMMHILDVKAAVNFFKEKLTECAFNHDRDKVTAIDQFHDDFVTNFKNTTWYQEHKKLNRHHLMDADGIPEDVNLLDVLEMVADCTVAGLARSGSVYELKVSNELLQKALTNTVDMLKSNIRIVE